LDNLEKQILALEKEGIRHRDHPKVKDYNSLIAKISIIVSTEIPLDLMDSIVKTIYNIYIKYAHIWPLLGSFRLWIIQANHETTDNHLEMKLPRIEVNFSTYAELMQRYKRKENVG
jgi:hypothetical protein